MNTLTKAAVVGALSAASLFGTVEMANAHGVLSPSGEDHFDTATCHGLMHYAQDVVSDGPGGNIYQLPDSVTQDKMDERCEHYAEDHGFYGQKSWSEFVTFLESHGGYGGGIEMVDVSWD